MKTKKTLANNKKIMHLTFARKPGGGEFYARVCAKYFARSGYEVHFVYCPSEFTTFYTELEKFNVSCIELDLRRNFFNSLKFLYDYTKQHDISLFHTHHYVADFIIEMLRLFKKRITHIASIHCMLKFYYKMSFTKCAYYLSCLFSYHRMDKIIAVSSETKSVSEKYFCLPKNKIKVIHNSIDFENIICEDSEINLLREKINPDGTFKILLCVGRLDERKAQEWVIGAIGKYLKGVKIKFVMVGEGEYQEKFECMAKELDIENQIVFEGHQAKPWPYYSIADFFIIPSLSEGLAGCLLEAMYFGLPVIASNIDGNKEVIVHNENGYIVPLRNEKAIAETIRLFIENPELAQSFGVRGQEMARSQFASKIMVDNIIEMIDSI